MPSPKLTKLELKIMEALWSHGMCSIREIQETFPLGIGRPIPPCRPRSTAWKPKGRLFAVRRGQQCGYFRGHNLPRRSPRQPD